MIGPPRAEVRTCFGAPDHKIDTEKPRGHRSGLNFMGNGDRVPEPRKDALIFGGKGAMPWQVAALRGVINRKKHRKRNCFRGVLPVCAQICALTTVRCVSGFVKHVAALRGCIQRVRRK